MPMGISLKAEANASAVICKDNHPLHFFKAQIKSFLKVTEERRKARERRAEGEDMEIKTERKSNTKNKRQRQLASEPAGCVSSHYPSASLIFSFSASTSSGNSLHTLAHSHITQKAYIERAYNGTYIHLQKTPFRVYFN